MSDRTLYSPPATGVHSWLFGRAVYLRRGGRDQLTALSDLSAHVATTTFRPGRAVSAREISDAVEAAYRGALTSPPPSRSGNPSAAEPHVAAYDPVNGWPSAMHTARAELKSARLASVLKAAGNFELIDFWEKSPLRPPDNAAPLWALEHLFAPDDLLCVGRTSKDFGAKPLRDWSSSELATAQFIVPNPLRKPIGTTKRGIESSHSRDATGARRYLIFESDAGLTTDDQAKILDHLQTKTHARLAAVVWSGGKSLHGWFRVGDTSAAMMHAWFRYAVSLGADPRLWFPEQFVRLPDGTRENGKRQSIIYLNPDA